MPAAGKGARFGRSASIKELYPLSLRGANGTVHRRPVCMFALEAFRIAGARRAVIVVAPGKSEIIETLGSGESVGLSLSYVEQPEPLGLPQAVRVAAPLLAGSDVLLALPDTAHFPRDALATIRAEHARRHADVVLGVFPTEEPERLGPVEILPDGSVARVFDKPGDGRISNTWGLACWSPRFTAFCSRWEQEAARGTARERVLGDVFDDARRSELRVAACLFEDGEFVDIGSPPGLAHALAVLSRRGLLSEGSE